MLQPLESLLFFDIETVPEIWAVEDRLNYDKKEIRSERYHKDTYPNEPADGSTWKPYGSYREKAALYPEFGKIICISLSFWRFEEWKLIIKSLSLKSWDEKEMISTFFKNISKSDRILWWHNIKWFDIPYIIKRALHYWLKIPKCLHIFWKKPREVKMVDTMELFKMWSWRNTSLELCTQFLGLPNPKQDITGKEVPEYYYSNPDNVDVMEKISKYCEADAEASLRVYYELFRSVNDEDEK